jgi:PAS domain S-box-containing protein
VEEQGMKKKHRYILLLIAVMLIICSYLFASFYNQARQEALRHINNEQFLQARQAARGIEDFFKDWTRILSSLAESTPVIIMDKTGKDNIALLLRANQDKIRAITRVDETGRIIYTFPFNSDAMGRNISHQHHIREIMATHKPVVSNVFYAVQGYDTVALHVPVFSDKEGIYKGTIGIAINFQALAKRYLEDIKIGQTGYAWMTSRDGTELYCPVPGHTGKSVYDNCRDFPTILVMAEEMLKGRQGSTTYTFDNIRGDKVELVEKNAVYMPINIGSTFWSIVVASSEDEIVASLKGFRNKLIGVIAFLIIGGVLFAYYGFKAWFIIGEEEKRRRAEEALRREQEFTQLLFDTSPAFIVAIGTDGKTIMMNKALLETLEYSEEEIRGKDYITTFVPEDDHTMTAEVFRKIVGGGKESINENRIRSRSGRMYLVEWHGRPVIRAGGDVEFFVGVGIDITAREKADAELRESEGKYRALIETTNTGFVIVDLNGLVVDANPEYVRLTGHRALNEIIGRSVIEWTAGYETEKNAAAIDECIRSGAVRNLQIDYVDAKGSITPLEINATVMRIGGESNILTICRDISERRRVEKLLRESEERLQRAEKMEALGTLAGGVAHDLNNVLGVVVGYAELLLSSVEKANPIRPRLVNIMKGGEQAAAIVEDLLTLARRGVPVREVVNLNDLIIDCRQSPEFDNLSSRHPSMVLDFDLDPELENISASPVHLRKTLYNLIANAGEAMAHGGVLTIKTANEYLDKPIHGYDEIREGEYVVLFVSDTGEGIEDADLKRIFEPFYTKKVMGRSGTGLGLAVVWGTVKDLQGYINVKSEKGKGSTFTLYFPVTGEKISAGSIAIDISEYLGKGETVLVVDDVTGQRDLAAEMLAGLNYNVTSAASGEEAVAYLKEHKVDLMVLDMIMDPGMDGLDTYRNVLAIHPGQRAVIVSGFSETHRVNAAQALGAGAYVRKPYVIEKLGLAVRKELDRKT